MGCDVCLVIADLGAGGAQRVLVTLGERLAHRGWRIAVVTLAGTEADHFRLAGGVSRTALGLRAPSAGLASALWSNWRRVIALRRAIRASGARVVVAFVGTTNILCVLACAGLPVRVVVSERNDPQRQSLGKPWDWLRRLLYRRADLVTANSAGALAAMAQYVPAPRLALVPNPMAVPDGIGGLVPSGNPPRVLCVGRISRQKAQDVLIDAFARIAAQLPDWRLAFVGEGNVDALAARARALGLQDRIDWIGPTQDIWDEYRRSDIFVLPSRHEGTPNALLEALACGLPCVVSDATAGALQYIFDDETGLVVPVEDSILLGQSLARLMADPALRRRLGNAGRDRVRDLASDAPVRAWEVALGLRHQNAA